MNGLRLVLLRGLSFPFLCIFAWLFLVAHSICPPLHTVRCPRLSSPPTLRPYNSRCRYPFGDWYPELSTPDPSLPPHRTCTSNCCVVLLALPIPSFQPSPRLSGTLNDRSGSTLIACKSTGNKYCTS
ncbi:hypothetical protein B0J13DRAFT_535621 [Dactylonectria estremocensis]|uniref:Uncharacterized protein n=1 Tax=Dactylonectria estremocensis TaxID=1079267 RepID=A0A9P9JDC1_9HYPO|nr:hypothetical protein B0J13DRAFT_535621 [Dactylonectria estremocensis]